jgi:hypothetical protein
MAICTLIQRINAHNNSHTNSSTRSNQQQQQQQQQPPPPVQQQQQQTVVDRIDVSAIHRGVVVAFVQEDILDELDGTSAMETLRYLANTVITTSKASSASALAAITIDSSLLLVGDSASSTSSNPRATTAIVVSDDKQTNNTNANTNNVPLTSETARFHRILDIMHKKRSGDVKRSVCCIARQH